MLLPQKRIITSFHRVCAVLAQAAAGTVLAAPYAVAKSNQSMTIRTEPDAIPPNAPINMAYFISRR